MYKVKFHYTEGHTHTATGVHAYQERHGEFAYCSTKHKDGISEQINVTVTMNDVLYIEVIDDSGETTIIPGLITKFTVIPDSKQLEKVNAQVLADKKEEQKYQELKEQKRIKNAERKKVQYAKQLGVSVEVLNSLHKK